MTDLEKRLKEIKARCDAATKGPWSDYHFCSYSGYGDVDQVDMIFAARARQDIPMLLEIVEVLISCAENESEAMEVFEEYK